eukprot:gene14942-20100_t
MSFLSNSSSTIIAGATLASCISLYGFNRFLRYYFDDMILKDAPVIGKKYIPTRVDHDRRRGMTYPEVITNTWYHLCDSNEVIAGKVIEIRAIGHVFVLWRNSDGNVVCQDAYCLHLGANLAVGGKVVDNCIECPFHKWKFASDGTVVEVPYISNPSQRPPVKKLKTYPCIEWCGLVCVYFHADDESPEFYPPAFVEEELKRDKWAPGLKWDIGFTTLNPVDWVDQAGDHTHFHTLHCDFLIPWTLIPIPQWILKIFPLGICHAVQTFRGDDPDWIERVKETGWGTGGKQLLFFTDQAGLTWNSKPLESTLSETIEMFTGPAMMTFNIPFKIGAFKVFVTTTPVDGGSIMRVRTWVDKRVDNSFVLRILTWFLAGISASQLWVDIVIMNNKIRLKKPVLQPFDGPYNRTNAWLKQFYSASSSILAQQGYRNDW